MGPGVLYVLERIRKYKSINRAAEQMSLSYVKALHMLNRLEADLDHRILIRKRGGNQRGGSELTSYGEKFVAEYSRLQERVQKHVEEEFRVFQKRMAKVEANES